MPSDPPFSFHSRGLYYEAGFGVSEVTSGLTLGIQVYDGGLLVLVVSKPTYRFELCFDIDFLFAPKSV